MPNLNAIGTISEQLILAVTIDVGELYGRVCAGILPADGVVPERELETALYGTRS
jgi:hypothetical protein